MTAPSIVASTAPARRPDLVAAPIALAAPVAPIAPVARVTPIASIAPIAPIAPVEAVEPGAPVETARPRPRWLVALVALAAAVAVSAGGYVAYGRLHVRAPPFRTARVTRADITQHVTATGTLQPVVTSPVGAQVSGIVWKLHADYNSVVKAGDLLVELDPALFLNAVALATAQLAQAEAGSMGALATSQGARLARDRSVLLQGEGLAGRADVDAAEAILGQSSGAARSQTAQIALARAELDRAKLDLEHSIIRSPVEGTVISRNVDVGQAVAATLTAPTLFTIASDLRHMQVHAAVDEADIGDVRPGQAATFTVDAFRDLTFSAVVHEVRNAPQTAQNVVTYDVVLDVENPDGKLRPGMTANVLILILQRTQVTAVPNEALRFRPSPSAGGATAASGGAKAPTDARAGAAVFVPQGSTPLRVPIKIGPTDGTMTEIDGLEPGREVITDVLHEKGKAPAAVGATHGP